MTELRKDAIEIFEGLLKRDANSDPDKPVAIVYINPFIILEVIAALKAEPCEDAIGRQAAIEAIWDGTNMDIYTREVKEILEGLSPIQPKAKTAHWVDCGEREPWYRCSNCGRRVWGGANHYCPECGAKMESESEG